MGLVLRATELVLWTHWSELRSCTTSGQSCHGLREAQGPGGDSTRHMLWAATNHDCGIWPPEYFEYTHQPSAVCTSACLQVQLLGMEHNPDIMLLAARALTFMADVLPTFCAAIVRHGAVPAFCARLLTIEYIDLAEQSLQALEKLSHEHPQALLQNGGLMAVLSYLDFFPTGVQRTAVSTAATMCTGLGPAHVSSVKDALPILCNLLQYQDAKVVDNACLALLHIAEAYSKDASLLEQLQTAGLINQALQLISINGSSSSSTQTSIATYFGMVKLLSTCASGSAAIAQQLLKAGVVDTLRQLLANCSMLSHSGSASPTVAPALRTPDQLYEVMTLVHELLPAVPDASDMILRDLPVASAVPAGQAAGSSAAAAAAAGRSNKPDELKQFLQSDSEMVMTICSSLLPLSLQVCSSLAASVAASVWRVMLMCNKAKPRAAVSVISMLNC